MVCRSEVSLLSSSVEASFWSVSTSAIFSHGCNINIPDLSLANQRATWHPLTRHKSSMKPSEGRQDSCVCDDIFRLQMVEWSQTLCYKFHSQPWALDLITLKTGNTSPWNELLIEEFLFGFKTYKAGDKNSWISAKHLILYLTLWLFDPARCPDTPARLGAANTGYLQHLQTSWQHCVLRKTLGHHPYMRRQKSNFGKTAKDLEISGRLQMFVATKAGCFWRDVGM